MNDNLLSGDAPVPHLGHVAERWVTRHGNYPAALFEGRWHTAREILDRSTRIAGGLVGIGLTPGQRVIVLMPNSLDVPIIYHAVWRAGGVVTPAMFLLSAEDLRHVIASSGASILITTPDLVANVDQATIRLPAPPQIVCAGSTSDEHVSLERLAEADPVEIADRKADDLAALLYTGGTTGRAKGVMLSHANLLFVGRLAADLEVEIGLELERELVVLPLSHVFGLVAALTQAFSYRPKSWVLVPRFEAAQIPSLIEEHRVNQLQVVPSMMQMLLAEPLENFDLSSLREVTCGGAPLAPETLSEFRRRIPSAAILEGYGLSETASVVSLNLPGAEKAGSVGPPNRGVDVRIAGDAGEWLAPGEVGEICCRSKAVMVGYWNAPEETAAAMADGWLRTGDVGYLDEDGCIFILDRKKEVIIRGGFNVYPRDVEDAMLKHPLVRAAGVVGRPDPVHGEEVVAFVELTNGAHVEPAGVVAWARERIGGYKYPREVHVVDALPLTGVGKVDRKALRSRLG